MQLETLLFSEHTGIAILTINRPEKMNALNAQVIQDLGRAIDEVISNPDIKAAIITGAGPKAFVAGADISEFASLDSEGGMQLARRGAEMVFDQIAYSTKPIVAAVNGFALGGGCELALACHFIIASETARFGQPEVNLGLIPGYGGTQRLTQACGKGRAMQLMMTGEMISATEAVRYGIANKEVPAVSLLEEAEKIIRVIMTKAPVAIAKVISCVNQFDHTQKGYDAEIKAFGECFSTEDKVEGTNAFLEKRKPVFQGK